MLHAMSLHTVLGLLAYLVNKILISLTSHARGAQKKHKKVLLLLLRPGHSARSSFLRHSDGGLLVNPLMQCTGGRGSVYAAGDAAAVLWPIFLEMSVIVR